LDGKVRGSAENDNLKPTKKQPSLFNTATYVEKTKYGVGGEESEEEDPDIL
jgi:hypothetical protein